MSENTKRKSEESAFQSALTEKLEGLFSGVIAEREYFYKHNPKEVPRQQDVQAIMDRFAAQNALVSGAIGLVPGPLGMAAAIPELIMVFRNQLRMVYDIGMAFGKEEVITKELLIGIFSSSVGVGGVGLVTMHGSKVLVRRASLRVIQRIIAFLGGKITQKALKSMIAKYLPGIGALGMAAYSRYTTKAMGEKAVEVFSRDIELCKDDELTDIDSLGIDLEDDSTEATPASPPESAHNIQVAQILVLCNLMKADGVARPEEIEFIQRIISELSLDEETQNLLNETLKTDKQSAIDFSIFERSPGFSVALLSSMVALANHDGEFHITEKLYIKQVGKLLGFEKSDIEELIDANA